MTRPKSWLLCLTMLTCIGLIHAPAAAQSQGRPEPTPPAQTIDERLSLQFQRLAAILMGEETLSIEAIETAQLLAAEAAVLTPDDVEVWRFAYQIALVAEDTEAQTLALKKIVRLDPRDDHARLLRINAALDRAETAEERLALARKFLDPSVRDRIGDTVASRIALDVALLEQRRGNVPAFVEALGTAAALDPANRRAAAIAAGFFRTRVDDAEGEAELLINLLLADPTNIATQVALAELLLEFGAYRGAARFYGLATRNQVALRNAPSEDLVADYAVALWGEGAAEQARTTIRSRQRLLNAVEQRRIAVEQPDIDPLDQARVVGLASPPLATVRALIAQATKAEDSPEMVAIAIASHEANLVQENGTPRDAATRALDLAWTALWLGAELEEGRLDGWIAAATDFDPLSAAMQARINGWRELRAGRAEAALALFDTAEADPPAALGRAEALAELGRERDAARQYLELARERPGTMIGVWCVSRLRDLLGRSLPINDRVERLETLAESVPSVLDGFPTEPTLAVEFNIREVRDVYPPYEPLTIVVEITNVSPIPLAIDRDGPIRPHVLLRLQSSASYFDRAGEVPPVIIDIDRVLSIQPRETITVPVDLRRTRLGNVLYGTSRSGSFLRVSAMINFVATSRGAIVPGSLGSEAWSGTMRIDGVDVDTQWMKARAAELSSGQAIPLAELAVINDISVMPLDDEAPPELFQAFEEMRAGVAAAYSRMPPKAQAWLLGTTAVTRLLNDMRAEARRSEDRLVQLVYLLLHANRPDDPAILKAMDGEDEALALLARRIQERLARSGTQLLPGTIPSR